MQLHATPCAQAKQDAAEEMEASKALKARIAELEQAEKDAGAARDAALLAIGNVVHDSVPVSDDEARFATAGFLLLLDFTAHVWLRTLGCGGLAGSGLGGLAAGSAGRGGWSRNRLTTSTPIGRQNPSPHPRPHHTHPPPRPTTRPSASGASRGARAGC